MGVLFIKESDIVMENVSPQLPLSIPVVLESVHQLLFFGELGGALFKPREPGQSLAVQLVNLLLVVCHQLFLFAHFEV